MVLKDCDKNQPVKETQKRQKNKKKTYRFLFADASGILQLWHELQQLDPTFASPNKRNANVHQLIPQRLNEALRSAHRYKTPIMSSNQPHILVHLPHM